MVILLCRRTPKLTIVIFFLEVLGAIFFLGGCEKRQNLGLKICAIILNLMSKSRFFEVKLYCKNMDFFGNFLDKIHKNPRNLRNYIKLNVTEQVSKIAIFAKKARFLSKNPRNFMDLYFFTRKIQNFKKKIKIFWIYGFGRKKVGF